MGDLARGDRVSHPTFGEGVVEAVRADAATVRFFVGKPRTILSSHLERLAGEELERRDPDAATLFDAYVIVDWSANSQPKRGSDSLWYCLLEPGEGRLFIANPSTRQEAFEEIRDELIELVGRGLRILVGFDFPYGFPAGTGELLGFSAGLAWRTMWDELGLLVEDGAGNKNNRFEVAADVNGGMTMGPAPFWGCPPSHVGPFLRSKKPKPWPPEIKEFRLTDKAISGPKSIWQLYGAGSVGSQALMGIPRLAALRDHEALEAVSQVWPFESGGAAPAVPAKGTACVVHAEIYPSLVPPSPLEDIKDAAQVRGLAEYLAHLDDKGELEAVLDLGALPEESRESAVAEEGWILGAQAPAE